MNKKEFSFVIAREGPGGQLSSYSFAGEVKFDTLKAAKEYCRFANEQLKKDKSYYPFDHHLKDYSDYNVYGLVKIDL